MPAPSLASARIPIQPYVSPRPGWAEQDPELYWRTLGDACCRVLADPAVRRDSIAGWRSPPSAARSSSRTRPARRCARPSSGSTSDGPRAWRPSAARWVSPSAPSGLRDTVAGFAADCEANWLRANEPDTWRAIRHYLGLSGFLLHRLTGRFVDSTAAQVGYLPFDYKRFRWAADGDWKWQVAPLERDWLPTLEPPTARLGDLTAAAAAATGLPAGLPVIAAAADKACEVLGSGALTPEVGSLSYGTTATVNTTSTRYIEPIRMIPPYPAAMPGRVDPRDPGVPRATGWSSGSSASSVTARWRRRRRRGIEPEVLFDDLVRAVPAGSMGLAPPAVLVTRACAIPGREAKGAIIGFGDVHTRAHLYRAILEGLAYALRDGAERTAGRTGVPLTSLRIAGGGSQSPAAVQLTADIFGLPVAKVHTHETSGLGAAIDAAVGLGLHPGRAHGGRGDGARRRGPRSGPRHARDLRRAVSRRLSADVSAAPAAVSRASAGSPATRPSRAGAGSRQPATRVALTTIELTKVSWKPCLVGQL